jgi:Tol biopolymer transport system component
MLATTGLTVARAITGTGTGGQATGGEPGGARPRPSWDPTTPVSVGKTGEPGDGESSTPVVAPDDPRVVAFASKADRLTDDDGNGLRDVFVHDHGVLTKISGSVPGTTFLGVTAGPSLSGRGDVVAYVATVTPPDGIPTTTLVVHDRRTGGIQLVPPAVPPGPRIDHVVLSTDRRVLVWDEGGDVYGSRLDSGPPVPVLVSSDRNGNPTGTSSDPSVSGDGACVAFASESPLLVPGDVNGVSDVFSRKGAFSPDPADDSMVLVSRATDGASADGPSSDPSISRDCTRIAYQTFATNVVPVDTNNTADVVVADEPSGTTVRITAGPGPSGEPSISADGGHVAFSSADTAPDPLPTSFQAYDRSGTPTYATSILSVDGPRVRVAFPPGLDFAAVTAGSVDAGALIDAQVVPLANADGRSNTNPLATVGVTVPGGPAGPALDVTDGPDLVSARVVPDDNSTPADDSDDVTAVRFCFDEGIAAILGDARGDGSSAVTTARFLIQGYDSVARHVSTDAAVEPGVDGAATPCLRARFPDDVDVSGYTLAVVFEAAVADDTGRINLKASRSLDGHTFTPRPGDITGPNLRGAIADVVANHAVFSFDRILGTGPPVAEAAGRFHFVDGDGNDHSGRAVTAVDRQAATVTVEFAPDTDNLLSARRFVALPDAVRNDAGGPNVEQSTDADVAGPELGSVARVGTTGAVYDFVFSATVVSPDPTRFFLATEDGTTFPVESAVNAGPDVIRVSAPAVEPFAAAVVLGIVQAGGVSEQTVGLTTGREGPGAGNPLGVKPTGRSAAAAGAASDGPDLVAVEPLPAEHAIDYIFDEAVREVHLLPAHPKLPPLRTDVFVADLKNGVIERVSVDSAGRPPAGTSSAPSISSKGGILVFLSSAALLPGDTNGLPDVFVRDLLVGAVSPGSADFGVVVVGGRSEVPATFSVSNLGPGGLPVTVALAGEGRGDFRLVDDRCSGRTLQRGETCTVGVVFGPSTAGPRTASLVVTDEAPGSPRTVPLTGFAIAAEPSLRVTPRVGRPGTVALVSGQGFPPAARLEVRWSTLSPRRAGAIDTTDTTGAAGATGRAGPARLPSQVGVVKADAQGRFRAVPLLILPGGGTGPRAVEVRGDGPAALARAPFLVTPNPMQPGARRAPGALPEVRYRR